MPAASSTTTATRSPAVCTASAFPSSTRSPNGSSSRSGETIRSFSRPTSAARRRANLLVTGTTKKRGTKVTFKPDSQIFEIDRLQLRHARAAAARARVPERRRHHHAGRRARREESPVPLRRRHRLVRRASEQEQGPGQREGDLHARRARRHRRRDRAAVERRLQPAGILVRQQHQHARRRHAPVRVPLGADAIGQLLRAAQQPDQGPEGRDHQRRRHPRRHDRRDQREDPAARSSRARPRRSWATPR